MSGEESVKLKPRRGRPPKPGALSAKERAAAYRERRAATVERQLLLYRAAIREIDKLTNPLSADRVSETHAEHPEVALAFLGSQTAAIIRQLDAWLLMAGTPRGDKMEMDHIIPSRDLAYADELQLGEDRKKAVKEWKEATASRPQSKNDRGKSA